MIERIPKCYVCEDAVQIRIPFDRRLTIVSSDYEKDGILCHYNLDSDSQNINKYFDDTRRNNFPYGNIPLYKEACWKMPDDIEYINYTNQILEFNKHYISVSDDFCIKDRYVVKDGEGAVLYSRIFCIPSKKMDIEVKKKEVFDMFKDNVLVCITRNGRCVNFKKDFKTFFNNYGGLLVLDDDGVIRFKIIEIIVRGRYYFMKEYNIPFNYYTLEELKAFEYKIKMVSEPRIYKMFNPNIERKEIREAKKLVRKLNNSK